MQQQTQSENPGPQGRLIFVATGEIVGAHLSPPLPPILQMRSGVLAPPLHMLPRSQLWLLPPQRQEVGRIVAWLKRWLRSEKRFDEGLANLICKLFYSAMLQERWADFALHSVPRIRLERQLIVRKFKRYNRARHKRLMECVLNVAIWLKLHEGRGVPSGRVRVHHFHYPGGRIDDLCCHTVLWGRFIRGELL